MLQTKEIFRLLNKKERINFCILMFLMLLNSVFEILGISSIIPIISITIKNDLSLFERMFFYDQIKSERFLVWAVRVQRLWFWGIGSFCLTRRIGVHDSLPRHLQQSYCKWTFSWLCIEKIIACLSREVTWLCAKIKDRTRGKH